MLGRGAEIAILIHHQHAQPIAGIEKLRRRRIVRGPVGVGTHFLQPANAEIPERIRHRNAYAGVVLVVARSQQLERLVIEEKSLVGIEADGAKTRSG